MSGKNKDDYLANLDEAKKDVSKYLSRFAADTNPLINVIGSLQFASDSCRECKSYQNKGYYLRNIPERKEVLIEIRRTSTGSLYHDSLNLRKGLVKWKEFCMEMNEDSCNKAIKLIKEIYDQNEKEILPLIKKGNEEKRKERNQLQ